MQKVVRQVFRRNSKYFKDLDLLTFYAKNVYNVALYDLKQAFFNEEKLLYKTTLVKKYRSEDQLDFRKLPTGVAANVVELACKTFKSFFGLLKLKVSGKYNKPVNIPRYLHKVNGRQVLHYNADPNGAEVSFKRKGFIKFLKSDFYVPMPPTLKREDVKWVRVVPKGNHMIVELGYEVHLPSQITNENIASIDLGVNNLAVLASNTFEPVIINGKPLKSINQYYNKEISRLKSLLPEKTYSSKKIKDLYSRRHFKIEDYLHKASRFIVNHLVSNNISTLVVGYNKEWKQDTNLGKRNNQNFVGIPFYRFLSMLKYKCQEKGIAVEVQEESYTSKCSFFDNEKVGKHGIYSGTRVGRGSFKTSSGIFVNADLNGSLNILRKFLEKKVAWNDQIWSDLVGVNCRPNIDKVSTFI